MAKKQCVARLRKEFQRLDAEPVPHIACAPLEDNILEWHFVISGPPATPYEGGAYHGKLIFPPEYPYRPPSIYMLTRSGRFDVNTRLCLSMRCASAPVARERSRGVRLTRRGPPSATPQPRLALAPCVRRSDFHPETWVPAWSVGTILNGVLSFMLESTPTVGSVETTLAQKRNFARLSHAANRKNAVFNQLFPQLVQAPALGADGEPIAPEADEPAASPGLLARPSLWVAVWVVVVALGLACSQL